MATTEGSRVFLSMTMPEDLLLSLEFGALPGKRMTLSGEAV
jgi:hypothetical protein